MCTTFTFGKDHMIYWQPAKTINPHSPGWYPCSIFMNERVLRWWNGVNWSWPCDASTDIADVGACGFLPTSAIEDLWWSADRWWDRPKM